MTDSRTDDVITALNKVPAVTLVFWIIKIFATTVGETAADVLSTTTSLTILASRWSPRRSSSAPRTSTRRELFY